MPNTKTFDSEGNQICHDCGGIILAMGYYNLETTSWDLCLDCSVKRSLAED